jgi:CheY-like chemotaxis protein/HPt (histidine-containing phosphotransfer) domain-containing protein
MDGLGLIEAIRQTPTLQASTIMMLTSGGHRVDKERCQSLGVASCLLKPIRKSELLSAVLMALGESNSAAQTALITRQKCAVQPRGLRILLAEDNRVNQRVAIRVLEKMGHSVLVANNGKEALSLLAAQPIDLVLMDIQMPEMDGLTATRKIREQEKQTGSHVAIIAMTAHAMKGDRERCLEGGMNGYVSKPIDRKELEQAIASAVPESDVTNIGRSVKGEEGNPLANELMAWDITKVLERLGGDEQLLRDVIGIFLEDIPTHMTNLRQGIAKGNAESIVKTAHSLKGELGYLGIPKVSQRARELEQMGSKNDLERVAGEFALFETEISAVIASIRSVIGTGAEVPPVAKASGNQ